MAQVTAKLIKELRDETGAGMMDVKKALVEADGDIARAKEIIRARGIAAAGKREGRKAQEGLIASTVVDTADGQTGYAIELNSETDFVAKTPKFVEFADGVLADAVAAKATTVAEVLAAPSTHGSSPDDTVDTVIKEASGTFGEHVKIGQYAVLSGERVEVYAHRKSAELPPSIVALVATDEAGAKVAHEAALQISAMSPRWLTRDDVDADTLASETRVATEKTEEELKEKGKPEAVIAKIAPKIVEGRLDAFYKETVLLEQEYVKDPKKTVADLFKEAGGKATGFVRIEVGKGASEEDAE